MSASPIKVKFLSKAQGQGQSVEPWLRLFPCGNPVLGRCEFIFDPYCRDYDWIVVYDELPKAKGREEVLACPRENTLLVTVEPSSIKTYGDAFLKQFGYILTGQEDWALRHPGKIWSQPALIWFYGSHATQGKNFDTIVAHPPTDKTEILSTVCSTKRQGHTLHRQRYVFTQELKKRLPYLAHYGRGVRDMADKSEALDHYKYHIAIENHRSPHWWTEKISDAFLGLTLPFYYGAPNLSDYFPNDSFIPIDIFDVEGSAQIIETAIKNDEYSKRIPAIRQARELVLHKYSLFATVADIIENRHVDGRPKSEHATLRGRHEFRRTLTGKLTTLSEKICWKINCARHAGDTY